MWCTAALSLSNYIHLHCPLRRRDRPFLTSLFNLAFDSGMRLSNTLALATTLGSAVFAGEHEQRTPPIRRSASALPIANSTTNEPIGSISAPYRDPIPKTYGGSNGSSYHSPAWLPSGEVLTPSLPQWVTNGASDLGMMNVSKLPQWLDGPMPQGFPWGRRTASNTNPYVSPPDTRVTRHYEFDINYMTISPDGVEKPGIVVNGAFPGPTIEANWGDWIEVVVRNNLENEGTSMHWHGLLQTGTPGMDGVPSVTQCPIPPGTTYVYRFQATLYGSSW